MFCWITTNEKGPAIRILFVVSFILLALIPPFYYINGILSADESGFMFIGDSINHGSILYKDFIDNKPPGIFYLNALIFLIFGKSFYASRIALFLINALSALIIYFLGKNQWNEHIGQLSSILFLIGVYNPLIEGYFVLTEQYMVFFGLLGIFVFLKFRDSDWRYLISAGFFLGIATLFKQPGILFYVIIIIYYFSGLLNKENRTKFFIYDISKSSLLILIGILIPIFITVVFFYREGVLYDFIYWSFLYFISGRYGTSFNITSLFQPIDSLVIIWIPALISVLIIIYNLMIKEVRYNNLLVVCWFLLFSYTLTTRQYGHYFIQILPPACILASITLTRLPKLKDIKDVFSKKGIVKIFIMIFIIGLIYHTILSSIYYENLIGSDRNLLLKNQIAVSEFIISHTQPNQRIVSIPYDPSIYFLSGRYPPINYLGLGMNLTLTPANEQDNLISLINRSDVPYIITNTRLKGWLNQNFSQFLQKNYLYGDNIGIYFIAHRKVKLVEVKLVDHAIASEVQNSVASEVTRTSTFQASDSRVYSWVSFGSIYGPHQVEWKWYSPNNALYFSDSIAIPDSKPKYESWNLLNLNCRLDIAGSKAASMPGNWRVNVFMDDQEILAEQFTIRSSGGTPQLPGPVL